jgi:hypothetical protein
MRETDAATNKGAAMGRPRVNREADPEAGTPTEHIKNCTKFPVEALVTFPDRRTAQSTRCPPMPT